MQRYKCYLCKAEVDLSKRRVKCHNCSKMSLVPLEELPQEKTVKKKNKAEPIFKGNTFEDDLKECREDLDFNKKVKFIVSPRETRAVEAITKKCNVCQKDFETKVPTENRCLKCCRGY